MLKMKQTKNVLLALPALFLASHANAAVDVSAVVAEINGTLAPIGLIASAVLIVAVTIMAYKWVRRAM